MVEDVLVTRPVDQLACGSNEIIADESSVHRHRTRTGHRRMSQPIPRRWDRGMLLAPPGSILPGAAHSATAKARQNRDGGDLARPKGAKGHPPLVAPGTTGPRSLRIGIRSPPSGKPQPEHA